MLQNRKNKKNDEREKLTRIHKFCIEALNEFSVNHPRQLPEYESEKIQKVIDRIFNSELDFLEESPEVYYELYADE